MTSSSRREPAQLTALLDAFKLRHRPVKLIADMPISRNEFTVAGLAQQAGYREDGQRRIEELLGVVDPLIRQAVINPLTPDAHGALNWGGFAVKQPDGTSCVPTVLAVLRMYGDIGVALWVLTGHDVTESSAALAGTRRGDQRAAYAQAEGARLGDDKDFEAQPEAIGRRFDELVASLREAATDRWKFRSWPKRWGVAPWHAAKVAQCGKWRYTDVMVNDVNPVSVKYGVSAAIIAAERHVPALIYVGGDSSTGYSTALPRHAVLLHWSDEHGLAVYEPSAGRVIPVQPEELARHDEPRDAYGGWQHITWVVVPVPR